MLRIIVAILLLWFVFFGSIPKIDLTPVPDKLDEVGSIIDLQAPSEDTIKKAKPVADLITDIEDRAKLALFNYEFAQRVVKYDTDAQKLNDLYVKAANNFFEQSLNGKYDNLAEEIEKLFEIVTSEDNHNLDENEKKSIKELFLGLSWLLLKK
jgi:hypothetical protein